MALKFRRRQKIFPGFYLNFSSKGISSTVGFKGLNVNIGQDGTYLNTGIPGTGIYDRQKISGKKSKKESLSKSLQGNEIAAEDQIIFLPKKLEGEIKSKNANEVTSTGLIELKETLLAAYKEKLEIEKEIQKLKLQSDNAKLLLVISKIFLFGFFIKWFDENYNEKKGYLRDLHEQLGNCKVNIEIDLDDEKREKYSQLKSAFIEAAKSNKIWDNTSAIDNTDNRSAASKTVTREQTRLGLKTLPFLNAKHKALYFENKNGSDIYIYPGFISLFDDKKSFGLVELNEVDVFFKESPFMEEEGVPSDAKVVGKTWAKVNKNGTPDKRFKDNYEIPVVEYGELTFKSKGGVHEGFCV